jgi:SAM-dependent methyltransferase
LYHFEERKTCRICAGTDLMPYLNLKAQPPSNAFISPKMISEETRIPLIANLCTNCGLSQLSVVVSHAEVFGEYAYRSSTSRALEQSFRELAEVVQTRVLPNKTLQPLVVDIGANDGLFLSQLPRTGYRLLGVEPSSAAEDARSRGLEIEQDFFGASSARTLHDKFGPADVISTSNVLAHVDDIHSYLEGIKIWLADEGWFLLEFPYIADMLDGLWFDTIYHEHVSYLSVTPLNAALAAHDLEIVDIQHREVGGSGPFVRLFIQHRVGGGSQTGVAAMYERRERIQGLHMPATYFQFAGRVERLAVEISHELQTWSEAGTTIGGFGAPAKGNTLLNYLELDPDLITVIADSTPGKIGCVTPGSHIPIVSDAEFLDRDIGLALLLSWNYLDHFLSHAEYIRRGGRFLTPFPTPNVVSRVDNHPPH